MSSVLYKLLLNGKALQIAQLIRDYTSVLANEKGIGRRKSVEFDLALRPQQIPSHQMLPPIPQPRKSAQHRGPVTEQMYQNATRQIQIQHHLYQQQQQQQMRRSRPLSILYKPPPQIIMTEPEHV